MRLRTWCLLASVGFFPACTHENAADSGSSGSAAENNAPPAGVFAVPQEELARTPDAVKLKGTITVKDYTSGLLQIDATLPVEGSTTSPQGTPPITVARYKAPGPYELLLPPKTTAINLSLILDIQENGPDAGDPRLTYAGNPVAITGNEVTGVDLTIENSPTALPPTDPASGSGTGSGAASGAVTGTGSSVGTGSGSAPDALSATHGTTVSSGTGTALPSSSPAVGAGSAASSATAVGSGTSPVAPAATPDPLDPALDKAPR